MESQPNYKKRGREAKKRENMQGTSMLTLRVPNELYNQYVDHCKSIGRSLNEVGLAALRREILTPPVPDYAVHSKLGPERNE